MKVVREIVERKFTCYAAPFMPRRFPSYFDSAERELEKAIERDLGRFLHPEVMAACRNDGYRPFLDALHGLFQELLENGVVTPT